jgi:putative transposase
MGRKGDCWDNTVAESFFGNLKREPIKKQIYKNRELATADVTTTSSHSTIEHARSHLGGLSPEQFRSSSQATAAPSPRNPGNSRTSALRTNAALQIDGDRRVGGSLSEGAILDVNGGDLNGLRIAPRLMVGSADYRRVEERYARRGRDRCRLHLRWVRLHGSWQRLNAPFATWNEDASLVYVNDSDRIVLSGPAAAGLQINPAATSRRRRASDPLRIHRGPGHFMATLAPGPDRSSHPHSSRPRSSVHLPAHH